MKNEIIKGRDLEEGMTVLRLDDNGNEAHHEMIVYEDSPYLGNRLYADDNFKLVGRAYSEERV